MPSDGVPEREKNSAAFLPAKISGDASMRHGLASKNQPDRSREDLSLIVSDAQSPAVLLRMSV